MSDAFPYSEVSLSRSCREVQLCSVSFPEELLVQPVIVEQLRLIDPCALMPVCVQSVLVAKGTI
jgi:hypothetical protein